MSDFDILWSVYPHAPGRKTKRTLIKATFNVVTGPGKTTYVDKLPIFSQATPAVLISAAKARHMELLGAATPAEGPKYEFEQGLAVWLNQARFEDWDQDERERLAAKYDDLQDRIQRNKLRIVK